MKKGLLLSVLMVMMSLTANAYDAEIDGIYYNLSGSKATVTYRDNQYRSYSGSVSIPESVSYNGQTYSVTDISGLAFAYCTDLNSVTIPNSVTSIGKRAFVGCSSLQSATIPSSVTEIGERAFEGCESLTSATIPDGVTEIGLGTFAGCTSLTSLTIGNGVTSIGMSAFAGCRLTSLVIPNNVTSIGAFAFANCSDITSVTFPNSLKSIGNQAFEACDKLTSLTIPNSVSFIANDAFFGCIGLTSFVIDKGNTMYDSRDNCNAIIETGSNTLIWGCSNTIIPNSVTSIGNYAFQVCEGLASVSIPEGVTSIGEGAFMRCSNLKTVSIPSSVTYIGSCTFMGCFNLTDFYCYAENVPKTEYDLFGDRPTSFFYHELPHESATLHVPAGSIEKYKATLPWKEFREIVALEEEQAKLIICVANNDETAPIDTLYTEDEILWFNDSTREIKFMYSDEEVREKLQSKNKYLEFRLGENVLFKATRTSNVMSHIITDLVLCMGSMERRPYSYAGFFLYDCYPLNKQAINDERTQANIQKRAPQWEIFLKHWESKGKLRHDPYDPNPQKLTISDLQFSDNHDYSENQSIILTKEGSVLNVQLQNYSSHPDTENFVITPKMSEGSDGNPCSVSIDVAPVNYSETCVITTFNVSFNVNGLEANSFYLSCWWFEGLVSLKEGEPLVLEDIVSFTKDQMATIILPTEPDASKGKYYRLDRCEEGKIIFTEELQPKARVPYIIVPNQDFTIDLNRLDLDSLLCDADSVKGAMFIGSYRSDEMVCQEGFYIDIIDVTPDCQIIDTDQRKATIGALRACLVAPWDDPYSQGGSRGITEKREIVLKDDPNGIYEVKSERVKSEKYDDAIYDLSGRKVNSQFSTFKAANERGENQTGLSSSEREQARPKVNSQFRKKGLYIEDGKKILVK